jgi:hypothetical protein
MDLGHEFGKGWTLAIPEACSAFPHNRYRWADSDVAVIFEGYSIGVGKQKRGPKFHR